MSRLHVADLSVQIDDHLILNGVSLELAESSVVAVLGPSGSGKSTLLRAIAGFVSASGRIQLGDRDIADLPTHKRNIGLMFQSHALFPHLDVADNVAFGLVESGVTRADAALRVAELLETVGLGGMAQRDVASLSGGEAQRVALARALAPQPALLMLDEPLGSLDRRLRDELALELAELLRTSGTSALYVTHDQEEAAVVANDLLILESGEVVAFGTTEQLWRTPATRWIAEFLGHANVSTDGVLPLGAVSVIDSSEPGAQVVATVQRSLFVDGSWRLELAVPEPVLGLSRIEARSNRRFDPGAHVGLIVDTGALHRFDPRH